MRTVWARELILEKLSVEQQQQQQQSSKLSPEKELLEFQKKISAKTVTKMGIGSEDYLIESIQREYADSIIDSFAELAQVLQEWHEQSLAEEEKGDATFSVDGRVESVIKTNANVLQDSTMPREEEDQEAEDEDVLPTQTKFCVFCGTKVPLVALHCSSCGKKQPQMQGNE